MEVSEITRVGVVGAGTMGSGIAELFAESGYAVIWYNRSEAGMQRGLARIRSNQQALTHHKILTPTNAEAALARLSPTDDPAALSAVPLLSESVAEDLAIKRELWGKPERLCRPEAIFTADTEDCRSPVAGARRRTAKCNLSQAPLSPPGPAPRSLLRPQGLPAQDRDTRASV
jgi:3-hydroxybutyryl-CoA dehydrogenase